MENFTRNSTSLFCVTSQNCLRIHTACSLLASMCASELKRSMKAGIPWLLRVYFKNVLPLLTLALEFEDNLKEYQDAWYEIQMLVKPEDIP